MLNGYRSLGNLLRSISEVESPEEYSPWCQRTKVDSTALNFNAHHCELTQILFQMKEKKNIKKTE